MKKEAVVDIFCCLICPTYDGDAEVGDYKILCFPPTPIQQLRYKKVRHAGPAIKRNAKKIHTYPYVPARRHGSITEVQKTRSHRI